MFHNSAAKQGYHKVLNNCHYFAAMYAIVRSFLFLFSPEWVHYFSMNWLKKLCSIGFMHRYLQKRYRPATAEPVRFLNLQFPNRVGLAAGFDKNALYLKELAALGFGHVEVGTATPRPQAGNDKPRLFRLKRDRALINRMGFNNDGVEVIAARLAQFKLSPEAANLIIGGNIGKNKETPNEYAYMDYDKCFRSLHPVVDYFVVNVSSPNTPGLRELQEKESLRQILTHLQEINASMQIKRPLLLKIAPDLTDEQLAEVVDLSTEINLDGLVIANTTLNRSMLTDAGKIKAGDAGAGGLSGAPARQRSTDMIKLVAKQTNGKLPIIGVGGIFTKADAQEKHAAGAALVQVWTGFVYEGPGIVKKILN